MATTLFWDSGNVKFADNDSQRLVQIDVSQFARIRVSAFNSIVSAGGVTLFLVHVVGVDAVTSIAEIFYAPGSNISTVFEVPGTILNVDVKGSGASAHQDTVRVLIYGEQ